MRKNKRVICLFITAMMALNCSACKSQVNHSTKETPYYSVTVDGGKKYYSEKSKKVTELKKMAEGFVIACGQSNYKKLEDVKNELGFYTKELKAS